MPGHVGRLLIITAFQPHVNLLRWQEIEAWRERGNWPRSLQLGSEGPEFTSEKQPLSPRQHGPQTALCPCSSSSFPFQPVGFCLLKQRLVVSACGLLPKTTLRFQKTLSFKRSLFKSVFFNLVIYYLSPPQGDFLNIFP